MSYFVLWYLSLVFFGGFFCSLQRVYVHESFAVVAPGYACDVAKSLRVPEDSLLFFAVTKVLKVFPAKTGAYDRAKLSDMLEGCIAGKQRLFPVCIIPGMTVAESFCELSKLPYVDASQPWSGGEALFPDTYYVAWGTPLKSVFCHAYKKLRVVAQELWSNRGQAVRHLSPEQLIVLSSIVEKETVAPEEISLVASVYIKRLGLDCRGRLYADPTVVYACAQSGAKPSRLFYRHLWFLHPYNTYRNSGLPPGPIAHPSKKVLAVVAGMQKLFQSYYFFKAPGKKTHVFSNTFIEHVTKRNAAYKR